jgi:HrpA-like RNA helicase
VFKCLIIAFSLLGHCLRLYAAEELVRENIEPEIVRSSLDAVMLQLVRLGYNPHLFPFMTDPSTEALSDSISLLEGLQCIKREADHKGTDKEFSITEYGRLFSELPFDPRLSAFVVACYREFDKLELAASIASLLSAPGNIYFMGGSTKEAKDAARLRVSTRASQFDSDLLCMASVFQGWYQAGAADEQHMCLHCRRKCPRDKGCRQCRVKYSIAEGLNNKVLDFVLSTSRSVHEIVKKAKFRSYCCEAY